MADVTIATAGGTPMPVLTGDLILQRIGAWTIHATVDGAAPTGAVVVRWLGADLRGYVYRSGVAEGKTTCMIVGGAGGLDKELTARHWSNSVPVRQVLSAILSDAGESLSNTATPSTLSATLAQWARVSQPAGDALNALADAAGAIWRVLPDGSIFFGRETWPRSTWTDYTLLAEDDAWAWSLLSPETFGILPGEEFPGEHVRRAGTVVYSIAPDSSRCRVWWQTSGVDEDPLQAGLARMAREAVRGVDYLAMYPAKVVAQRSDGTLDVQPDSVRIPPMSNVRYLGPCYGAKLTIPAGARVLVGFDGGDPRRAYACGHDAGAGSLSAARVSDRTSGFTITGVFVMGVCTGLIIVDGALGATYTINAGAPGPFTIRDKISEGSPHLKLLPGT